MHFRSNGKLLLTGEYLVLRGAKALALPLKKGQSLEIEELENDGHPHLLWFAFGPDKLWFKSSFELPSLDIIGTDDRKRSSKLQLILLTLNQLNPDIFNGKYSYKIKTRLDFNPEWGFGSSSTLIANLSRWAKVDPYSLLNLSIGGSGYDVACAMSDKALIYQINTLRPNIQKIAFNPDFREKLLFVYNDKKQDSSEEVKRFNRLHHENDLTATIDKINQITNEIIVNTSFHAFCNLMKEHETILSDVLQLPVLAERFPDFDGQIKSLGAWGGDFFLAMSDKPTEEIRDYFKKQGLSTFFTFDELIL
ncbi:MAG: GYDIA family GHMP kinase [Bacteroidales bacterium]